MEFGKKEKNAIIIGIVIFVIIIIIGFIINHKEKTKKPNIPYETKEAKKIQSYIDKIYEEYQTKDNIITYNDSKNKNIYSVLIVVKNNSELGDYIVPKYISYNYDESTGQMITDEKLASMYGYTIEKIYDKIVSRFKSWYEDEAEIGYVDKNECNFDECYLSYYRNIESLDEFQLFVEDGQLYAYIGFDVDSFQDDREYFDNLDYDYYKIKIN